MGDFRIVIEGVGNHGCGRGKEKPEVRHGVKDGVPFEEPTGRLVLATTNDGAGRCNSPRCVDCMVRNLVARMAANNAASVMKAEIQHWPVPGAAGAVREKPEDAGPVDDLLADTRSKPF